MSDLIEMLQGSLYACNSIRSYLDDAGYPAEGNPHGQLAEIEATLTEAAAALEAAREDAWQQIETAPKDQAVLVTFAAGDIPAGQVTMPGVMVAYWDAYYAIGGNGHDGIGRGWVDAHSGEGCHLHYGHPTHWRPLSAPSATDQARGKGVADA